MRTSLRAPVVLACAALCAVPSTAAAATASGTLQAGKGWTVIALAPGGTSRVATASRGGRFTVRLSGKGTTLQLVRPDGRYFGPVVLGRRSRGRAPVALAGKTATLGRITRKHGYAVVRHAAPRRALSSAPGARVSRRGAPLGAASLGLKRVVAKRAAASQSGDDADPGADPDADGLPNAVDADDNGNGTADAVDARSANAPGIGLFSEIERRPENALNADAAPVGAAQIDALIRESLRINLFSPGTLPGASTKVTGIDVDCAQLVYCRSGSGTALAANGGLTPPALVGRTWASIDANGDGLPDLPASTQQPGAFGLQIQPNVTAAQIAPGDTYRFDMRTAGADTVVPAALTTYFLTTPAIQSANGSAVAYPATPASLGSQANPVRLSGDALTLRFWRPQRAALPGEAGTLTDMGGLHYGVRVNDPVSQQPIACGASRYGGLSPSLSVDPSQTGPAAVNVLQDSRADAAPSAAATLGFSFDLGGCLRAAGVDPTARLLPVPLSATGTPGRRGGTDSSSQLVYVCFPGCTVPATAGPGPGATR